MLKLQPNPTFIADVSIPVPGADDVVVQFVFKYKDLGELKDYVARLTTMEDADAILEITEGWQGIDAPFTANTVQVLVLKYAGVGARIYRAYYNELNKARLGN